MLRLFHLTTLPQTAASFLTGQLSWMQARGFEVTVISSPGPQLQQFADREGIRAIEVPLRREIAPASDLRTVRHLARLFGTHQPDILHAHTPKAGLLGMIAATICRVPIRIYHLHGLRFETSHGPSRHLLRSTDRLACRLAHQVLAVSPSLRQRAIEEGLVRPDRIYVPHRGSINGVDLQQFCYDQQGPQLRRRVRERLGIPHEARVIGFIGRLVRDKGVEELARAWSALRNTHPDLRLLVVGPFETADAVSDAVRTQLQSDPRVHLMGLDWDVKPYLAAMDVFTLPSHREGLGVVLLEAAAMKLPIVTTQVTGCVDAVQDGVTGFNVPARDAEALRFALELYLSDRELRIRHGQAGRRWVAQEFVPSKIWSDLRDIYLQLAEIHLGTTHQELSAMVNA